MSAVKPPCKTAAKFVVAHGESFAPFTGQDYAAWDAFVHLLDCYAKADQRGRANLLRAMFWTIQSAQQSVWSTFQKAIPHAFDWGDEETLWTKIMEAAP